MIEAIVDAGALIVTVTWKESEQQVKDGGKTYHWTKEGEKTPFCLVKILLTFCPDVESSLANFLVGRSL
jgi:hypothetical protein